MINLRAIGEHVAHLKGQRAHAQRLPRGLGHQHGDAIPGEEAKARRQAPPQQHLPRFEGRQRRRRGPGAPGKQRFRPNPQHLQLAGLRGRPGRKQHGGGGEGGQGLQPVVGPKSLKLLRPKGGVGLEQQMRRCT